MTTGQQYIEAGLKRRSYLQPILAALEIITWTDSHEEQLKKVFRYSDTELSERKETLTNQAGDLVKLSKRELIKMAQTPTT